MSLLLVAIYNEYILYIYTSFKPQNLRNILLSKKLLKLALLKLLSNMSVKTTVFGYFFDMPQISPV